MPAPYTGRCVCGATKYRLNDEPVLIYACHCTDCQKRSGSAFGLSMWVRTSTLEVLQGDPVLHESKTEAGRPMHIRFCGVCNSRMWSDSLRRPGLTIVRGGTLDDTSWLRPQAHLWTRSAQKWFVFPEGVPCYDTQSDEFFAEALNIAGRAKK